MEGAASSVNRWISVQEIAPRIRVPAHLVIVLLHFTELQIRNGEVDKEMEETLEASED